MSAEVSLQESFQVAGKEFGYSAVKAEYTPFKEFKIKWQRSAGWAEFQVSDYLMDADKEIIEGLARSLFIRITKGKRDPYPETMKDWMTSTDFVKLKQPVYVRRSRNLTRSPQGSFRNLLDSVQRLTSQGMVDEDEEMFISWTKENNHRRVGYCSVLMKVIAISSIFDNPEVPEYVLDYVVYHEMLHLNNGVDPDSPKHGPEFRAQERLFPRWEEAEAWLRRIALHN